MELGLHHPMAYVSTSLGVRLGEGGLLEMILAPPHVLLPTSFAQRLTKHLHHPVLMAPVAALLSTPTCTADRLLLGGGVEGATVASSSLV